MPDASSTRLAQYFGHASAAGEDNVLITDDFGDSYQGDLTISGAGLSFGGGLHYFVSPKVALGGAVKWTVGEFSTVEFDNVSIDGLEMDVTTTRVNFGITWFPMAKSRR